MWETMPHTQKERAVEEWETRRAAIERAREIRLQPPVLVAGEDSEEDEAPRTHDAATPGLAAAVRGVTPRVPAMPVTREPEAPQPHREKSVHDLVGHLALVTRQLTPSELRHNPSAMQALDHEWEKLAKMGARDASGVCEYEAARKRAG